MNQIEVLFYVTPAFRNFRLVQTEGARQVQSESNTFNEGLQEIGKSIQ